MTLVPQQHDNAHCIQALLMNSLNKQQHASDPNMTDYKECTLEKSDS